MPRYKILIEYEGTRYNGWQVQPEGQTIQREIEKALSQILRQPIGVAGQGRTDSGVHAEAQAAHFDAPRKLEKRELLHALAGVLPRDIAVWEMEEVASDFHARFDGKARQYRYQIIRRPSPLLRAFAAYIPGPLDVNLMQQCAAMVAGTHDFQCFTKSDNDSKGAVCEVMTSELIVAGYLITYRIKANRFVRHMVRRLVGTMIQAGQGKREAADFEHLLHNPDKRISGHGARAKGLILEKVFY